MIATYFFIACLNLATASDPFMIRIPRGTFEVPVQYTLAEGDETRNGLGDLEFEFAFFTIRPTWHTDQARSSFEVRAVRIADTDISMRLNIPMPIFDSSLSFRNPRFEFSFPDVLITPVSDSEDLIVARSTNPTEYAYEGRIFYTPMFTEGPRPGIMPRLRLRTAIRLGGATPHAAADTDDFVPCSISANDRANIEIPARLREEFLTRLNQMEGITIPTTSIVGNIIAMRVDGPGRLTELPSLDIIIPAEDGTEVQIAQLHPQDYAVSTDEPNEYHIIFGTSSRFTLTRRIISNLLLHIDYENDRVGFADPLFEL